MKKSLYQIFVYVTLFLFLLTAFFFVFEMKQADGWNIYAIVSLVFMIFSIVLFVLNQVFYRLFKIRDSSRYEEIECPHCHTMNRKKELFCRNCGKSLHSKK